jgi:hypothetical protein
MRTDLLFFFFFCAGVVYSGEYDACDVTLSVYPHRTSLKNMPLKNMPPWPGIFFKLVRCGYTLRVTSQATDLLFSSNTPTRGDYLGHKSIKIESILSIYNFL